MIDGICPTVTAAARSLGLSWPTTMDAVRQTAAPWTVSTPPPVDTLGIDEVRRGRPRWRPAENPTPPPPGPAAHEPTGGEPAKARVLADRWHVGFTDLHGGHGMLGQVEGRTGDDVAYWLASQPPA